MKPYLFLILSVIFSCKEENPDVYKDCAEYQNLKVIDNISQVSGVITFHDSYVINDVELVSEHQIMTTLFPCNLDESFQQEGLNVIFDGYLLESQDNEDIAGQVIILTNIEIKN
ncbi:hypothetical protein [Echinicola salinicaeni]|uniref:hypothetical protein n=1 Tax=Echinicola salinicaeni TaxID=2762757 RepID=UPI001644F019|nr:hypothetical protein [Echinicola salinicaeni]